MGTTAEKLTYLNTTKQKIKDAINNIGGNITSETTFRQYVAALESIYQSMPKVSGSGTSLSLSPTLKGLMQIDLKGNTSQNGTPTPDYPQDIHNVSGNNNIVVCGKNLFDKDNAIFLNLIFGIENHKMSTSANGKSTYINCLPNTTYTISKVADVRFQVATTSEVPAQNVSYNDDYIANDTGNKITITTSANAKYLVIYYWHNSSTRTEQAVLDTLQVEKGNITNPTYEAYTRTTYPINLPSGMELSKIGTYQDYIYKENDKWYLHKEIYKYVFDGTENWRADSGTQGTDYRHNISISTTYLNVPRPININKTYISNYFSQQTITYDVGELGVFYCNNNWFVFPDKNKVYDLEGFKTWLSTHNTSVYYVLATPINTEITDTTLIEQLEAIYNAKSYLGTTNISQTNNDLPFIIDVSALLGSGS